MQSVPSPTLFQLRDEEPVRLPDGRKALVLALSGRLDGQAQEECDRQFARRVNEGAVCFILDGHGLDFVSSAGVRCFIKLIKQTRPAGGGVVLCRPQETVRQLFEIAGLGNLLPVADDLSGAIGRF
jgi:anti-sigma B factor antagonist